MDSVHFGEHTVLKVVSNATVDLNAIDILSYSNKELVETRRVLDVWDWNRSTIGQTPRQPDDDDDDDDEDEEQSKKT
jgi:hypothetical protein